MKISIPARLLLVSMCLLPGRADAEDRAFRFLAVGDLPYSAAQVPLFNRLVKQSEQEDFEFLMHVGDIQAGGIPCTDSAAQSIRDLFGTYPKPAVETTTSPTIHLR